MMGMYKAFFRIDQVLPDISYGDAVSNHALALRDVFRSMGMESELYAQNIHPKLKDTVREYNEYPAGTRNAVVYHMATASDMIFEVGRQRGLTKIMMYHNVTPEHFFAGYSTAHANACRDAREQLKRAKNMYDHSFGDSEYNCMELRQLGYKNVKELPILIPYADYDKEPSEDILDRLSDGCTNILFLGRIVPNKKQEDVIKCFYYYKRYFDKDSRLFLVGSYDGMETYYQALKALAGSLELEDVYFTGKIPFDQILAYYRRAHVFLSMSEHEGFFVPAIESMYFDVPVIAYKEAAIPFTLKEAGVMLKEKNYQLTAGMIDQLVHNPKLRSKIVEGQRARLADFSYEKVAGMTRDYFKRILGVENE
jgi:glycosyltransferase involved in cell wall biosynthesis